MWENPSTSAGRFDVYSLWLLFFFSVDVSAAHNKLCSIGFTLNTHCMRAHEWLSRRCTANVPELTMSSWFNMFWCSHIHSTDSCVSAICKHPTHTHFLSFYLSSLFYIQKKEKKKQPLFYYSSKATRFYMLPWGILILCSKSIRCINVICLCVHADIMACIPHGSCEMLLQTENLVYIFTLLYDLQWSFLLLLFWKEMAILNDHILFTIPIRWLVDVE